MHNDVQALAPELMAPYAEQMRSVCRDAWEQGLLSGCNGNASLRLSAPGHETVCLTRSGAAKGRLTAADCCLVNLADGAPLCGGPAPPNRACIWPFTAPCRAVQPYCTRIRAAC